MVRKLIIRIAKDEAGESNFSNLSSEELNEIRTELYGFCMQQNF